MRKSKVLDLGKDVKNFELVQKDGRLIHGFPSETRTWVRLFNKEEEFQTVFCERQLLDITHLYTMDLLLHVQFVV